MTSYQGGKKRIGKRIYAVIRSLEQQLVGDDKLPYFEPFVGMGGVLRHFARESDRKVTACDANIDLILMWKALQKGWKPPTKCTREQYERLKESHEHSPERAFLGIVASYGSIFFNGYRLQYDKKFLDEGYRGLMDIRPDILNVRFLNARSYDKHQPIGKLIYCDPPYLNNRLCSQYFQDFDHNHFWDIMREWSRHNIVVISESIAPKDFKKIWCIESYVSTARQEKTKRYMDCLFIHYTWFNLIDHSLLGS
jgi:site-specific DNA-adenine methylase